MARPKISVGLPVYNGERYLQNALTRLLEQDFEDFTDSLLPERGEHRLGRKS